MNFRYIECIKPNQLIQNFFELNVEQSSTPLSSRIIPTAQSHILFFKSQLPLQTGVNNKIFKNKGIVVFGQSYKSYTLLAQKPYYNFGINFHTICDVFYLSWMNIISPAICCTFLLDFSKNRT